MGEALGERHDPPGPPMAVNTGECGGRFPIKEQLESLGIYTGKVSVQHDFMSDQLWMLLPPQLSLLGT